MLKMRVFWKRFVRGLASPAAIFKFRRYHPSHSAEFLQGLEGTDHTYHHHGEKRHYDAIRPYPRWRD